MGADKEQFVDCAASTRKEIQQLHAFSLDSFAHFAVEIRELSLSGVNAIVVEDMEVVRYVLC